MARALLFGALVGIIDDEPEEALMSRCRSARRVVHASLTVLLAAALTGCRTDSGTCEQMQALARKDPVLKALGAGVDENAELQSCKKKVDELQSSSPKRHACEMECASKSTTHKAAARCMIDCRSEGGGSASAGAPLIDSVGTLNAYEKDPVAADRAWKGRRVELWAPFLSYSIVSNNAACGKDTQGHDQSCMLLGPPARTSNPWFFCSFSPSREKELAAVKKGDLMKVLGVVAGREKNVILTDCELLR